MEGLISQCSNPTVGERIYLYLAPEVEVEKESLRSAPANPLEELISQGLRKGCRELSEVPVMISFDFVSLYPNIKADI